MNAKELGAQPAYPGEFVLHPVGEVGNSVPIMVMGAGLTKREAFAMAAMTGLLTKRSDMKIKLASGEELSLADSYAFLSRMCADALLAELAKDTTP